MIAKSSIDRSVDEFLVIINLACAQKKTCSHFFIPLINAMAPNPSAYKGSL